MMGVSVAACQSMGTHPISDAYTLYQWGDYAGATQLYEEVLAGDPELAVACFYLGNSYDNLYKPDLHRSKSGY